MLKNVDPQNIKRKKHVFNFKNKRKIRTYVKYVDPRNKKRKNAFC